MNSCRVIALRVAQNGTCFCADPEPVLPELRTAIPAWHYFGVSFGSRKTLVRSSGS